MFAGDKSNCGGVWNGVNASVAAQFCGDASQLVAQLIGVATSAGFVFAFSFSFAFTSRPILHSGLSTLPLTLAMLIIFSSAGTKLTARASR